MNSYKIMKYTKDNLFYNYILTFRHNICLSGLQKDPG